MIVLGSYAAMLRGDLPRHREVARDIDLWGTREEAAAFHAISAPHVGMGESGSRLAWSIFPEEGDKVRIDFDTEDTPYRHAMPVLPGDVDLFGARARVITLAGQRAITRTLAPRGEKHARDLSEWGAGPFDQTLADLFAAYLRTHEEGSSS